MAALRYVAILLVLASLGGLLWLNNRDGTMDNVKVVIADETFTLDIAADRDSIEHGLMGVEEIEPDGGMIFVFARPRSPNFWMKNCLVDIDLLYLDEQRKIVGTHKMKAEPPQGENESNDLYEARLRGKYPSDRFITFAVELKAGTIERLGLGKGDRLEFDHLALKRLAR